MKVLTSGDSSDKMTAPRVSTWMTFAVGSDGPDIQIEEGIKS
jgi:hypothetical protein